MKFRVVLYVLVFAELALYVALARGIQPLPGTPAVWPGCDVNELLDNGPFALPMCQWRAL